MAGYADPAGAASPVDQQPETTGLVVERLQQFDAGHAGRVPVVEQQATPTAFGSVDAADW